MNVQEQIKKHIVSLFGGLPLRVLDAGQSEIIELCTSQALLDEFADVIVRPNFDRKFEETSISRRRMAGSEGISKYNIRDCGRLSQRIGTLKAPSAHKTGISIYILRTEDKKYLAETYASSLGKATVTGYCIRFKNLKDINTDVLEAACAFGFENTNKKAS